LKKSTICFKEDKIIENGEVDFKSKEKGATNATVDSSTNFRDGILNGIEDYINSKIDIEILDSDEE